MSKKIKHTIQGIGTTEISLYPPSDLVYQCLERNGEYKRLNMLRHLGALSHSIPGTRQARWDYTYAMLYYSTNLNLPGMNSSFHIGSVEFSSGISALQVISLIWNIGHLPGTFPVEKGLFRFLIETDKKNPINNIYWKYDEYDFIRSIKTLSNKFLETYDYLGLSRILAINRWLTFTESTEDDLFKIGKDFIIPFLLGGEYPESKQWYKLSSAFKLIRHLAYLTIDVPYSGLNWSMSIPELFSQSVSSNDTSLEKVNSEITEILSPLERATYEKIYHSKDARKESAFISEMVFNHLRNLNDAKPTIKYWQSKGLIQDLKIKKLSFPIDLHRIGQIKIRSHFISLPDKPIFIENQLRQKGFSHPNVFSYLAWNIDVLLEPDEYIIDILTKDPINTKDIGKLLIWIINRFENENPKPDEIIDILTKNELEEGYISLISTAMNTRFGDYELKLQPWRNKEFGIFTELNIWPSRGCLWVTNAKMDDPIAKHIFYNRINQIDKLLQHSYSEYIGIIKLRQWLRKTWKDHEMRQRCVILTSSIQICKNNITIIELDGGIVTISARSGLIKLYGLETKTGRKNPMISLRNRLLEYGIKANIKKIEKRFAVAEITL